MVRDEVREVFDPLGGEPADGGRPLGRFGNHVVAGAHDVVHVRRVLRRAFGHGVGVEPDGVLVEEPLVVLAFADDDVGHGAGEGPVGAGVDGEPFVGVARRAFAEAVVYECDGDAGFAGFRDFVDLSHAAHAGFARAASEEDAAVGVFDG